jgi:hypothetical protein
MLKIFRLLVIAFLLFITTGTLCSNANDRSGIFIKHLNIKEQKLPLAINAYSLTPGNGDISFTAFQTSFPDGFEFITLRRIDLRNVVVTDNGITSSNTMLTGEGSYVFPNLLALSDVPSGTIVRVDEAPGTNDLDPSDGVIHIFGNGSLLAGATNFSLSQLGDQIIAYTGASTSPTFIAGIAGADVAANWNTGGTNAVTSKAPGTISDLFFSSTDNAFYNGTVLGSASTIRSSLLNTAYWNLSATAQVARFNRKNIQFLEPVYSGGAITVFDAIPTGFSINASTLTFLNESQENTRYAVVIRQAASPSAPADRYTCYPGNLNQLTVNFNSAPIIKQSATDVCTGVDGNGKIVYLGYDKPSQLIVQGLSPNTTYVVSVFAVNGNGWSSNFSTIPVQFTQTTPTGLPLLTTQTPTSITDNSAIVPGMIVNDGGAAVIERGMVWDVIPDPDFSGIGSSYEGTGTGSFSSSIFGLDPQTNYHARAYAVNSNGVAYGNNQSFYTLSNRPTSQAAAFSAYAQSASQINLAWEPAVFPSIGASVKGYVLIRALSPQIPSLLNGQGAAPVAAIGTIVSSTLGEGAVTFNNTGLLASTTYTYLLVPFCWDGVHPETYNYLTTNAGIASATTFPLPCSPPTIQSMNVVINTITTNSLNLSWTAGNGNRSLVVLKAGSPVTSLPTNGDLYASNASFGSGQMLNANEFVVFNGTGNSVVITNLSPSTTYHVAVFSYNISGNCYLDALPATNQATTNSVGFIETFEPGVKTTYPSANALCNLGVWNFTDALIGTTAGSDRFNGTRSSRLINNGSIEMQFDKTNGIDSLRILHSTYGSDATSTWILEASNNGGASFDAFVSQTYTSNNTSALAPIVIQLHLTGNIRIRIRKISGAGSRLNIDDIAFSDYLPTNTISTGAFTPNSICQSLGLNAPISVPFTTTGTFEASNIFTAQLSDPSGNFDNPTNIGSLASAISGNISASIPAHLQEGANYKIRVISSRPEVIGTPQVGSLTLLKSASDVSSFFPSSISGSSVSLGWINPVACFDEVMIVAKQANEVTAIPSGNGGSYSSNANFGNAGANANLPVGEFCVYRSTSGNTATINSLSSGFQVYFKIFVRKGLQWSEGVMISVMPINPQIGDFRTQNSGNYSTPSIWQTYNGVSWVTSSIFPNQFGAASGTANVTIRAGHTVILDATRATNPIRNLTVETGSKIWTQDSTFNNNRYLTIYGNILCNGTIGRGANQYDNISFNIEGNPSTIYGSGSFNASRIRKNYTLQVNSKLIMAMSGGLKFSPAAGFSNGTCLYNNAGGNNRFDFTLNENCILNFYSTSVSSSNLSIDGADGEGNGEMYGSFIINGTLNVQGTIFGFTNNSVRSVLFQIGNAGTVSCYSVCTGNPASANVSVQNGSASGGSTFQILQGGKLNLTGGKKSFLNSYNKPFALRNNTSALFSFVDGLGTTNNVFDFQLGSVVEYSSQTGVVKLQSASLVYPNLILSGGATKTIQSSIQINENLEMVSPSVLKPNGNTIQLGGSWRNYNRQGFQEDGLSTVHFNGNSLQSINCPNGETFDNLTISNSSVEGVVLNSDLQVAKVLDLSNNGKLNFGNLPRVVSLTNMLSGGPYLIGGPASRIDLSAGEHRLNLSIESHLYTGTLLCGSNSVVNYNRNAAFSGTTGNQQIVGNTQYAQLILGGSGNKAMNESFSLTGHLIVDGSSTQLSSPVSNQTLQFGADIRLEAGASMNSNCFDNLNLVSSSPNGNQSLEGNGNSFRCYNFTSEKTGNGGLTLLAGSSLLVKNDLSIKQSDVSTFSDGGNLIQVGDDAIITGEPERFNFTGTLTMQGNSDLINTLGDENQLVCKASINHFNVGSSVAGGETRLLPNGGGSTLNVKGNFSISNGTIGAPGKLNPSANRVVIGGNWNNYNESAFLETGSEICLCGTLLSQSVQTNSGEIFNRLTINSPNQVSMLSNVQAKGELNMQLGNIDMGNRLLTVGESTANPGILNHTAGRVIGIMQRWYAPQINSGSATGLFPVGNSLFEQFVQIEYSTAPSQGGSLTVSFMEEDMANFGVPSVNYQIPLAGTCPAFSVSRLSEQGYWQISESNGLTGGLYDITFDAEGFDIVNDPCAITALKRTGSGTWLESGAHVQTQGIATRPLVKRQGASGWSNWGFGAGGTNPLPIELLGFDAKEVNGEVQLSWKTATEINNNKFVVERSRDAVNFEFVTEQQGAGNSNTILNYIATDKNPFNGIGYYRLKQVDFDGQHTFSDVKSVNVVKQNKFDFAYLNLKDGVLRFGLTNPSKSLVISIIDLSGRVVRSLQLENSIQDFEIDMSSFEKGLYLLSVSNSKESIYSKLVR